MSAPTPKPEAIPVSTEWEFSPSRAFYLKHQKHDASIVDLTPDLAKVFESTLTPSLNLTAAQDLLIPALNKTSTPQVIYTIHKENLLGTHMVVKDAEKKEVAEWKIPILTLHMGRTTITFLHPERHQEAPPAAGGVQRVEDVTGTEGRKEEAETLQVTPTGVLGKKAEEFTKDGIRYIWEVEKHKHERKTLYKVIHSDSNTPSKIDIAHFVQPSTHTKDGLLVLDAREIDALTGILTLAAMLEVNDSFASGF